MANKAKIAVLREKYELLKDAFKDEGYDSTLDTLAKKIVVPMIELSFDEGCQMWEYLLKRYYGCKFPVDYHKITDNLLRELDYEIAKRVFSENDIICDYVFRLDPYESHLGCDYFIADLIRENQFQLAEKLMNLYFQNSNGENNTQNNIFELIHGVIISDTSRWKMKSEGIDFISKWIPLVNSDTKRAELEVALLDLIDVVENGAPKGGMPFSLFASEGGFERLMEEKKKQAGRNATKTETSIPKKASTSFEQYMEQRQQKREAIAEIETAQSKFKGVFDMDALQKCQDELNSLIGLADVKDEVTSLTNLIQIQKMRTEMGLIVPDTSHHLVFTGNPGTGKTTVARIIGKIYHALGILSKGHFIEVDRSGLVAGYVGQTALKTKEIIDNALGGVLFIDEAYSLYSSSENDFGREAVDTLLKAMEDHRDDFIVIVAGYESLMPKFINSNPGLKSRFNKYIHFPDYNGDELMSIFLSLLEKNQYYVEPTASSFIAEYFTDLYINRDSEFGNGRTVRNIFEKVVSAQANRVVHNATLSADVLKKITIDDIKFAIR